MILDLPRFLTAEKPYWQELETILHRVENDPLHAMTMEEALRFHYLYQRSSAALARVSTFSAEPRTREYLESLVARAYAEVHEHRGVSERPKPWHWISQTVPQTFRRQVGAFYLALVITILGTGFGAAAVCFDKDAKAVLMPFSSLRESPAERVKREEGKANDRLANHKSSFSAQLMTHNIQVALFTLALGVTWGFGSLVVLFYNGVILGAVGADYIQAGFTPFLLGWLMPHGVIEIPAILVGGQAGFVLAGALIGRGKAGSRRLRLRRASHDVLTLAGLAAVMLVWAGLVESFLSQYHEPVLPYALKIAFGCAELAGLCFYLSRAGYKAE